MSAGITANLPNGNGAERCGRACPTVPPMSLIEARGLVKTFDDFVAVDGIDFEVQPGESLGFLGPHGAGKTSTMRMIGCTSPISGGSLRVLDMGPRTQGPQIRAQLGVVPQQDWLDTELKVDENLLVYGRYFGLSRAESARPPYPRTARARTSACAHARCAAVTGPLPGTPVTCRRQACVIANANASAASAGRGRVLSCRICRTISWTCSFGARPLPVTAALISLGVWVATGIPARVAATIARPAT